jgi:putative transposon-encoded protein
MSREKPQEEYETEVTCFGNGAKIKAYKKHIGKRVLVKIITNQEGNEND